MKKLLSLLILHSAFLIIAKAETLTIDGDLDVVETLSIHGAKLEPIYVKGGEYQTVDRKVIYRDNVITYTKADPASLTHGGLALIVIDRETGNIESATSYWVYHNTDQRTALAEALNALDPSKIVVLASDGAWKTNDALRAALYRVGASPVIEIHGNNPYRRSYALIGIPGIGAGNGLEAYSESAQTQPMAQIAAFLIKIGSEPLAISGLNNESILLDDGTSSIEEDLEVEGDVTISGGLSMHHSWNRFGLKTKTLGVNAGSGKWYKIARIQNNQNNLHGGEVAQFTGTAYIQTDYGRTADEQYHAIFSFGARPNNIKPLLTEFGDAAKRGPSHGSRIEWAIYEDSDGWHYLYFYQSRFSQTATFVYAGNYITEYWIEEDPGTVDGLTQVWSSIDNPERQGMKTGDLTLTNGGITFPNGHTLSGANDFSFNRDLNVSGDAFIESDFGAELNLSNLSSGKEWQVVSGTGGGFEIGNVTDALTDSAAPFYIAPSGKVGLGTQSPSARLTTVHSGTLVGNSDNISGAGLLIAAKYGNTKLALDSNEIRQFGHWLYLSGDDGIRFQTGDAKNGDNLTAMVIPSSGRVGIRTDNPKKDFHVAGDIYARGHLWLHAFEGDGNSGTAYIQARDVSGDSDINLRFRTQKSGVIKEAVHISPEGKVGINAISPQAALDVAGDANFRENVTFEGSIIITNPAGDIPMFGE